MLPDTTVFSSYQKNSRWVSFFLTSIVIFFAFVNGGIFWRGSYLMNVLAITILGAGVFVFLVTRTRMMRSGLIRTGLEWVFIMLFLTSILLWIVSPSPRSGVDRIMWVMADMLLFYLLLEAYDAGLDRIGVLYGFLACSGALLILCVLEVYGRYSLWWQQVGFGVSPPYPYRLISIIGHSNALMGILNLCAPLAAIALLGKQGKWVRILAGVWLGLYLIVLPFTSSRGGWIGFVAWVGILSIYWIWRNRFIPRLRLSVGRRVIWIGFLGVLCLVGILFILFRFWVVFSSHPTHGAGLLSSRTPIWESAVRMWESSPLIGIGQGRFGIEYLRVNPTIPPDYWATHAHNIFLQNAAEGGVIQLLVLIVAMAAISIWLWRRFLSTSALYQAWAAGILAAIFSWVVQNFTDDLTNWGAVMVPFIFLLAWMAVSSGEPAQRWPQINGNILWIPLVLVTMSALWGIWAMRSMSDGIGFAGNGKWAQAANRISSSVARDPNFPFYATQAGLAWSKAWGNDKNPLALQEARRYLARSLSIESLPSLLWADLAILDWYSGDRVSALNHIKHATTISTTEPSYPLMGGWFMEQLGELDQAKSTYHEVLGKNPSWSDHPFWLQTDLRRQVKDEWVKNHPSLQNAQDAYWQQADHAFQAGDIKEANRLLAFADWVGEPGLPIYVLRGKIFEHEGNLPAAILSYEQVRRLVDQPNLHGANFAQIYSTWLYFHDGLGFDLVPGYMQLEADYGQFTALERLYKLYEQSGRCSDAERTWNSLRVAMHGGSLEYTEPAPVCKSIPQSE